jgi:hypothetical protein
MRISIIVEWENVLLSEMDRCREMLRRLADQVASIEQRGATQGGTLGRLVFPFELIVAFDPGAVSRETVAGVLADSLPAGQDVLHVRLEAAPGLEYYGMKNHGATIATGDVVVFLDSDVIPQPLWLERLLGAFDDPAVQVVGGNTFIEPLSVYTRALAAGWFFPFQAPEARVVVSKYFFANNVAFDRGVLAAHPFRPVAGQSRGACTRLAADLTRQGIQPRLHKGAQVSHPPPNGVRHFFVRALAHGRDEVIQDELAARTSAAAGWRRVIASTRRGLSRVVRHRRDLRLSWAGLPAAGLVVVVYYATYLVGDLCTRVAPQAMRARFQI